MGDALDGLVVDLSRGTGDAFERVRLQWARVVGPGLARVARPLGLESGVLRVAVVSESWRRGLEDQARRIVGRLRTFAPVQRLRFEVAGPAARPAEVAGPAVEIPADPRNATVADAALRHALDALSAAATHRRSRP